MLSPGAIAGFGPERLASLFAPLAGFARVGLAVSGGPDSLALLLLFAAWSPAGTKPEAIVYTLDHGLRPESAGEAEAVASLCHRMGVAVRVLRWQGPKPRAGVQAGARRARYRLIGAAMAQDGAACLAVAHHRDDQAETVLMRLAHGSGAHGAAGMRAEAIVEGVPVLRPLLACSRAELAEIVARADLVPADDPSNRDPAYERVRWRHALGTLAPLGLDAERLGRFAARLDRLDRFAERETARFVARHFERDALGVFRAPAAALSGADPEILVRALRAVLAVAGGGMPERLGGIEDLAAALAASGASKHTLMGAQIVAGLDGVLFHREAARMARDPVPLPAGVAVEFDGRFRIRAKGAGFAVAPSLAITRAEAQAFAGTAIAAPMAAVRATPSVRDAAGVLVGLGTLTAVSELTVEAFDPGPGDAR